MSRAKTVRDRQGKFRQAVLEQLRKIPIVEVACERAQVNRATYYRWLKSSKSFAAQAEAALADGRATVSSMAESQVISLIRQGKFEAVRYWLTHNSARYATKVEVSGTVATRDPMDAAQRRLVAEALGKSTLKLYEKAPREKSR